MKIVSVANRPLTDREVSFIQRFRSYADGVSFVCLRERVMVIVDGVSSTDAEKLTAKARERMDIALSEHPDLSTWAMDDGYQMACLPAGVFAISAEPCEESMGVYFSLRADCLDACEQGEIIAVAFEEE